MKIAVGSDHAAYAFKLQILAHLDQNHLEYEDLGTFSEDRTDYPVYGEKVARAVASGEFDKGLLFCGTGVGISLAANKVAGIRAVVCSEPYTAIHSRRHNDTNVLALGSRVVGIELAKLIVDSWLAVPFEGGRHQTRVDMLSRLEQGGTAHPSVTFDTLYVIWYYVDWGYLRGNSIRKNPAVCIHAGVCERKERKMSSIAENVTGFQHLGVPVASLEDSIEFYTKIGFTVSDRFEIKENGESTKVAFLNIGSFCLELYQQSGRATSKDFAPGPIEHFALDVLDIDEAFSNVKAAGFELLQDAPIGLPLRERGIRYFVVLGPDGEKVEFNQIL